LSIADLRLAIDSGGSCYTAFSIGNQQSSISNSGAGEIADFRLAIADGRNSKLEIRNSEKTPPRPSEADSRISVFEFRFSARAIDNQQPAISNAHTLIWSVQSVMLPRRSDFISS